MCARLLANIVRSENAAVAPTVALSLFALIAVAGIAFDYARMASLDTELQQASDQAALSAASQLDGDDTACGRAVSAARSLITNNTLFANDGNTDGRNVTIPNQTANNGCGNGTTDKVKFYSVYNSTTKTITTDPTAAKFVSVTVNTRQATYALTPVAGAFNSGALTGTAVAGTESAICGVVPFFICNPSEPSNNTDPKYAVSIPPGRGILMLEGGQQKGPGNFGFLAYAGRGASNLSEALSANVVTDECLATSTVETEPGQKASVFAALNARFDMTAPCTSGPCSPSTNELKDQVRQAGSCNWQENPTTLASLSTNSPGRYRPTTLNTNPMPVTVTPEIMGHPRDICHATKQGGQCPTSTNDPNGQIGDGVWDRGAYFRSNHPGLDWQNEPGLGPNVTRYQTYLWEAQDTANRLGSKNSTTAGWKAYGTPQAGVCNPPGIAPSSGSDRRRLTAAVVNCHAAGKININGRKTLQVAAFMDVFLVEPSLNRTKCSSGGGCTTKYTDSEDIYVETIGDSGIAEGGNTPQITRRTIPRLIE